MPRPSRRTRRLRSKVCWPGGSHAISADPTTMAGTRHTTRPPPRPMQRHAWLFAHLPSPRRPVSASFALPPPPPETRDRPSVWRLRIVSLRPRDPTSAADGRLLLADFSPPAPRPLVADRPRRATSSRRPSSPVIEAQLPFTPLCAPTAPCVTLTRSRLLRSPLPVPLALPPLVDSPSTAHCLVSKPPRAYCRPSVPLFAIST